jgi:hypothetical protein
LGTKLARIRTLLGLSRLLVVKKFNAKSQVKRSEEWLRYIEEGESRAAMKEGVLQALEMVLGRKDCLSDESVYQDYVKELEDRLIDVSGQRLKVLRGLIGWNKPEFVHILQKKEGIRINRALLFRIENAVNKTPVELNTLLAMERVLGYEGCLTNEKNYLAYLKLLVERQEANL